MNDSFSSKVISKQSEDAIRAIFTGWLETTSGRRKISTIKRYYKKHARTVPLNELPEKAIEPKYELRDFRRSDYAGLFGFTNDRLEKAFVKLPERYQQVLVYYYVFEMRSSDIAKHLEVNLDVLYNIKSRALRKLRKDLTNGRETKR